MYLYFLVCIFELQRGLDMMGDITYCPQCQAAVVKEENALNLAQCMVCGFSFCMECSEPVHPVSNYHNMKKNQQAWFDLIYCV